MSELPARFGQPVGVEELLGAPLPVVHGRVKSSPQDFQVREISADSSVVGFSDHKRHPPTAEERQKVADEMLEALAASTKRERLVFAEPEGGWRNALDSLVGVEAALAIQSVSQRESDEYILAAPNEFEDRVFLQVCIQHCFPGLDCKLLKPHEGTAGTDAKIQVALDPVYRKLFGAGMSFGNCDKVLRFLRAGADDPASRPGLELDHEDTKEARTELHRIISKQTSFFKTTTESRQGSQRVVVYFSSKKSKKRKRSDPEPLVRFVLRKTNYEHFSCLEKLSRLLRCPQSAFSYAGTKDKIAITYQHVTVSGVNPEKLLEISSTSESSSFEVGNLVYTASPMSLGEAKGNRFTITIRDLSIAENAELKETLAANIQHVKSVGFINYFGFQRVGLPSFAIRPHHIGEKMIAGNWRDAVRLLLALDKRDSADIRMAKQAYLDKGDVDAALKGLPKSMNTERSLLQGLKRHGADAFEQAVNCIPHSRRLLFLHAYQSYLFNRAASFRIRHGGLKAVEGDLVVGDASEDPVRAITAKEAAEMNMSLTNPLELVVLPLAGTSVLLPANAVGEHIQELAAQDGTKDALLVAGSLKGSYRRLIALPTEVSWSLDEGAPMSMPVSEPSVAGEAAATISFSLGAGSFATMCLREVLKTDV